MRLLAFINLWLCVMCACCEVRVITINYMLWCWGRVDSGLIGCAGVVVGVVVGECEQGAVEC